MARFRVTRVALGVVALVGGALLLSAGPAYAERAFESQITEGNGVAFANPWGVAIDGSDNIWVSDTGNHRVVKLSPSGGFDAQNDGTGSWGGFPFVQGLAYGKTADLVYAADSDHDDIWGVNTADATYANVDLNSGLGGGCCYIYAAVDNSGTATDGDIYVATSGTSLTRITSSGSPADFTAGSAVGTNALTGADTPGGAFNARNVVVDSVGNFYVVDPYNAVVDKFSPTGAFIQVFDGTGAPGGFSGAGGFSGLQGIAIDPTNENILVVDHGNDVVDEFDAAGGYLDQLKGIGPSEATPFGNLTGGIAVNSTGSVYVADIGNGAVDVFTPNAILPKVSYGPVTSQTHTSGTLNASVSINGGADITSCVFQYGTDSSYGSSAPCSPGTPYSSDTSVSRELTGLTPDVTYHYRVVLITANGTRNGADQTFTPHAVTNLSTEPATEVTATGATLGASFAGEGEDVHYYFEWSADSSFGNRTAVPPGILVPSPTGAQSVSFTLENLEPDTLYRYRVVASDAIGTTVAPSRTFTTLGSYQFSAAYGSPGAGDGQLDHPADVAVDRSSGDLYVADTGNDRVVKLDSSGGFISAWGWGVGGGVGYEVCTSSCQAGITGKSAGEFESPGFIEVDNSNGPSHGDVYVADNSRVDVQKFGPNGAQIESWGDGGSIGFSDSGPIQGITVDDSGNLFVGAEGNYWTEVGQDGVSSRRISTENYSEYSVGQPDGHGIDVNAVGNFYQASVDGVNVAPPADSDSIERADTEHGPAGNPTGLAVDRPTGDLYVSHGSFLYQFPASDGCYGDSWKPINCEPSDTFGQGHLAGASGLAINSTTKTLYAANTGAGDVVVFSPLPLADVTTRAATATGPTSAMLNGHLDPLGSSISRCFFEYGTDSTLGLGIVPCAQSTPISGPADVSAEVSGLSPLTSYQFRLVAIRSDGKGLPSYGREFTYTPVASAPPSVDRTFVSAVTPTTATLNATINPSLAGTTYVFQYSTDTSFGSHTLPGESIAGDASDHDISTTLTGLDPGTTYHFRVVATNFSGVTTGPDELFNTPEAPSVSDLEAGAITSSTATLGAQVKSGYSPTAYHFEYGPGPAYGSSSPQVRLPGSDNSRHSASIVVTGLRPATTYHFRIVASNEIGAAEAPDQTLTTAAVPPGTPAKCKKHFVRRRGKCVKARKHRRRHHTRSANHG